MLATWASNIKFAPFSFESEYRTAVRAFVEAVGFTLYNLATIYFIVRIDFA